MIDEFEGIPLVKESELLGSTGNYQRDITSDRFDSIIRKLIETQDELFRCDDTEKKKQLKEQIEALRDMIILTQLEGCDSAKIQRYYDTKQMASKPYVLWQLDFARVFREKGGFDIVIGNPPYIGEEGHKEIFQEVAATEFGRKYYIGKMDFWYFFTSKALHLLRRDGVLSYIAPNNWMTTAGGKNMRKHIVSEATLLQFTTFNNVMIFESASQQTMVFLIQNAKKTAPYDMQYKAVGNRTLEHEELSVFLNSTRIGTSYKSTIDPCSYDGATIQFLNADILRVADLIRSGKKIYLKNDEIINGIHPHHACVTKKMLPILPNASIGDGIFIVSDVELSDMNLSANEKTLIHPYYDSTQISRYFFDAKTDKHIIYTTSDFKDVSLMGSYPNIKKHLDHYVDVITSDNRPYGLHRARKQEFFENPKIVSIRKCQYPQFSYVEQPSYVTAEWYLIMTSRVDMKYLTCLLNSRLIKFWLLKMGKMQGNIFQVDKEPLVNIPILVPDAALEESMKVLFDHIMKVRNSNKNGDISEFEKQIDKLVYEAYGLSTPVIDAIEEELCAWENKK